MSATIYFNGTDELVVLTNQFLLSGAPTDPASVTLTITDPTSVVTTPTPTRLSAGVYTATISATLAGVWAYTWDGAGTPSLGQASAIESGTFTVARAAVNQYYTSLEQVKSRLGITNSNDDFEIQLAVEAAAADVEQFTGRYFYQTSDTRTYRNTNIYDLDIDDTVSISQFATSTAGTGVFDTVWSPTQYQLGVTFHKYNQKSKGEAWPFTYLQALGVPGGLYLPYVWAWSRQDRCQVTGVFGWPQVPVNVREATLLLAVDHFKRKDAPFGVAGFSEYGAVRITGNSLVANLLHRYVKTEVKVGV